MSDLSKFLGLDKKPTLLDALNKAAAAAVNTSPEVAKIVKAVSEAGADGKIDAKEVGTIINAAHAGLAEEIAKVVVSVIRDLENKYDVRSPVQDDVITELIAQKLHDTIGLS